MELSDTQINAIASAVAAKLTESTEFQDKLMDRFLDRLYLQTGKSFWKKAWAAVLVSLAFIVAAISGFKIEMPDWVKAILKG